MAKKALPVDRPNRRTSSTGPVKSRVTKSSKNDGKIDTFGPLDPTGLGNKRTGKDFSPSAPNVKRAGRPDGLGDEDSTRKGDGYVGARAHVHRTPGIEAVRLEGDNIETFAQGEPPDILDTP